MTDFRIYQTGSITPLKSLRSVDIQIHYGFMLRALALLGIT